jgi:hypothetical protein
MTPAQNVGHQVSALEAHGVPTMRRLVVRRAVNVVEDGRWQTALRKPAEIMKVVTVAQALDVSTFACQGLPRISRCPLPARA